MDTQAISFKALTQKYTIKIPRIQRDYAQGRENAQKIREKFVKDLFESLKNDKTLHLQFIYGSVKNAPDKNNGEKDEFIPLDGQQRLTTLYLLHWYILTRNNITESYLANFTYETRSSSREFCKALSENTQKFYQAMQEALAQIQEKKKSKSNETILSTTIKDQAWFLPFWEQDPTIQFMLTMLDSIHTEASKYSLDTLTLERLYNNLDKLTFSLIEIKDFGLDDELYINELYIKMNARGAPLSEWENFKAAFEDFLGEKFGGELKDKQEEISQKLDNKWLETLFNYVKYQGEEKQMERIELAQSYMLNIIKYLCEMLYYKANENEKSSFDWDKVHFDHFDEKLESSSPTKKGFYATQNAHSMNKIFNKEALEILIYVFDNFGEIKDEAEKIFINFTTTIGESVGDKVCIFDKKDTKNSNEITSGKELFAAMVQDTRLSNKEQTRKLSRKDALYLFALISLMKKQDENKTNKLREVRNYCNYMNQKYLSNGALSYTSAIQDDMGKHIAECVKICDDNNIVIKNKLVKEFEDHQYFKGDLKLLLGKEKASGEVPLDEVDTTMLEKAQNILNTTPTHRIIANLIYHRFDGNFWLGWTYDKGKFLFGGTEAWHIMLTQNWKNKIDGELATAFKTMFKDGLKSSYELCKKFTPHQWQYYFIKYSKSFFKENHNLFIWSNEEASPLEIYRLIHKKTTPPLINPFLWTIKEKINEILKLQVKYGAEDEAVASTEAKEHFIVITGKCEIRCENNSFVLTPLSDEYKKALEKSSLKPSNKNFTISLTDHKDIIETLIDLFKSSNNPN
ncbi:DUF262 domain-containing protein [Campylobacter upsaliensis]|uniref:DUF262 domain-containing protein n=1 Tax=Campylobacter upsaliensis TaxID=28080 RepID=UPI002B390A3C|nr:DUF262 domain-containing protein [Campylobacter upsaliensis]MEB2817671.1 DUF262 domain-containing protein [Campylobacter upsaliensis]